MVVPRIWSWLKKKPYLLLKSDIPSDLYGNCMLMLEEVLLKKLDLTDLILLKKHHPHLWKKTTQQGCSQDPWIGKDDWSTSGPTSFRPSSSTLW